MRLLFFVLLLANLGFFAWQYQMRGGLADQKTAHKDIPAVDPGVTPLVLLSERDDASAMHPASGAETLPLSQAQSSDAQAGATPEPVEDVVQDEPREAEQVIEDAPAQAGGSGDAPVPGDGRAAAVIARYCFELGPFEDRAVMERLRLEAQEAGGRADLREQTRTIQDGYWIRLPEYLSYDEARARYRELQKKGVEDIAIVPLPDRRYFISLGVYKRKDTVEDRRKEVLAAGITPMIEDRMVDRTEYSVDVEYETPDPAQLRELRERLTTRAPKLPVRETECR